MTSLPVHQVLSNEGYLVRPGQHFTVIEYLRYPRAASLFLNCEDLVVESGLLKKETLNTNEVSNLLYFLDSVIAPRSARTTMERSRVTALPYAS